MKGYTTSKDYKKFKELLDSGYAVISMVQGQYKLPHISFSVKYKEGKSDYYALCGYIWRETWPESFEEYCALYDMEYIMPIV